MAIKVCILLFFAGLIAAPALTISASIALAREQTVAFLIVLAIALIESKSPGLAAAKPASIISTPSLSNCFAILIFSS